MAGADAGWRLATPLTTIRRRRWAQDLERLETVIRERAAGALVLGWPLNMDGSEGPRCQAVRAFADQLDAALGLPILLWDERLTTFAAEEAARAGRPARQETRRDAGRARRGRGAPGSPEHARAPPPRLVVEI